MCRKSWLFVCAVVFFLLLGTFWGVYRFSRREPWPAEEMAKYVDVDFIEKAENEAPLPDIQIELHNGGLSRLAAEHEGTRKWLIDTVKRPEESWQTRREALWTLGLIEGAGGQADYLLSLSTWIADTRPPDRREALFRNVVRQRLLEFILVSQLSDNQCIEVLQRVYPQEWIETLRSLKEMAHEQGLPEEQAFQKKIGERAEQLLRAARAGTVNGP